jgi:site-specific DNA recombinase
MKANPLTATELIKATKEELLRTGYTSFMLIDRVWMNLEKYINSKGIHYFSPEVGLSFLEERYHFSADPKSHSNTDRLRAIQLLEDFQAHERIMVGAGNERWHTSNINQILRNEKYIGDALLQKTYTTDFLTKTRVKNHGIVPQYYVENSHEAIIPREIFMQVQEELIRRRIVHTIPNGKNRTFSSTHSFSNMIICGGCGEFFRRIHWNNRGKKSIVWRCISRLENTGQFCDARTVLESTIEQVLVTAINQMLCDKDSFLSILRDNIETIISHGNDTTLADIDKRFEELQTELVKLANSKAEYDKAGDEIYRLRDEKQKVQLEIIGHDELKNRIADMSVFLREQPTAITQYDEMLVRRLIGKVTVYEDKFTVEFKSGSVTVDVNE